MRLVLTESLHARPADLLVRVASRYASQIEIRAGEKRANAKDLVEVLGLEAVQGDSVLLSALGADAAPALEALTALVQGQFDADLAPESGAAASAGFACGRAAVLGVPSFEADTTGEFPLPERMARAFVRVRTDLEDLVRALPRDEAVLFEPEIEIVRALESPVLARVQRGENPAEAIRAEATPPGASVCDRILAFGTSDLVVDACGRILDALLGKDQARLARLISQAEGSELVLLTEVLTPSIVASLPERVIGIVAAGEAQCQRRPGVGYSSHAAILARGRGIPLLFVHEHILTSVADGAEIVLDTRSAPPRLWVSPSEKLRCWAQMERQAYVRATMDERARSSVDRIILAGREGTPFFVRVNVGSVYDPVPAGADGIGLVRTELLFAACSRAPAVEDQRATLLLVAGKTARGPIVVRLFDAGGDKPLSWLKAPPGAFDARGMDLLLRYPEVLAAQLSAIAGAHERADVAALVPLVRGAEDIEAVRRLAAPGLRIGAMIETPQAVARASEIARSADFVCIGTNDLAAFARGEDRSTAGLQPIDARMLDLIGQTVDAAHGHGRSVTVCGEVAADPEQAKILVGAGVDAISVASSRFAAVKKTLAAVSQEDCRKAARAARGGYG